MQNFSQILIESRERKNFDSYSLLSSEINTYVNKVKRQLSKQVQDVIYLTDKYGLRDAEILQRVLDASKSEMSKIAVETKVSELDLLNLQKLMLALKKNIKLIPQFQTPAEREALESGRITVDDLTLDLTTDAGRNAAAKQYTPIVYKIVNQYLGKSSLDRAALISAGMLGLAEAIKDFDPEKTDKPFKTYVSYRVAQAILDDINAYSHSLSGTNWYAAKNYGDTLDAVSIDSLSRDDDDDYATDHLSALGMSDDHRWLDLSRDDQEYWKALYKIIDSKFSTRECNIFYRFFGLGDFWGKKEKSKDIAKSYGMSEGNIRNSVINKMLKFLKSDPKSRNILLALQTIYNESLMREMIYFSDKQMIYESLISDDMFILLEELNRWSNKNVYKNSISAALDNLSTEDALYIIKCLENGFSYIDDSYKKHKNVIVGFLKYVYPTETFNKASDVAIIDKLSELSDVSNEYKIKW